MAKRQSAATIAQSITEFNARSGKFLVLMTGSSGLATDPTVAQVVALEIATDATGYATRPAVTAGSPVASGSGSTAGFTSSQTFVITATASMSFDGYAVIYGGTSARGNTTGTLDHYVNGADFSTVSISAGGTATLTINLGEYSTLL